MRKNHVIGGVVVFSAGLFLCYHYSPYVVETIKGAMQPILILTGLVALAAGILGNSNLRTANFIVASLLLVLGLYGLYDEYYAVIDFFYGLMPPLLVFGGIVSIVYGIKKLR
ncbi:MAG TPA: hypothetical protein HPP58_00070 [Deltaproteobacteria bacterium]|nr:hypothetical protein [Deltaproteobacteria bacterium]HIJ39637.1 hypothetical protein [Deltaproteobacteria bacterium]